jgi:hypothetical protein
MALSRSLTIVKVIELFLIGIFIVLVPDIFNLLLKTLAKLVKI